MATLALAIGGRALGGSEYGGILSAVGAAAGAYIDSQLFAPSQPNQIGPRLNDLSVQLATNGVPIPLLYGKDRFAGNVIWATDLVEVQSEESVDGGGKGGNDGPKQTTFTYYANFAVGLCEGPIDGISQIYADKKLIWEGGSGGNVDDSITVYLGTEEQLPDPTIESHQGVGNVPAYRGTAYIVFNMLPLADYGNRIPQIEVVALAKTNATLDFDSNFVMKSSAPDSATAPTHNLWRNFSERPDVYGNAVFFTPGHAICISPAGDTVWTKSQNDFVDDINAFHGSALYAHGDIGIKTAATITVADSTTGDETSYAVIVGTAVKDGTHNWAICALYESVASGTPTLLGWVRTTTGATGCPYTEAGSVFLGNDHLEIDPIFVSGTMLVGATALGWRLFPSVSEILGVDGGSGPTHEITAVTLYWYGTSGDAYQHLLHAGTTEGYYNQTAAGGWCVPKYVLVGGDVFTEPHLCMYLPYGWMQDNSAGLSANPETRDVLAPAYPNGCVVDINLRLAAIDALASDTNPYGGQFAYWEARAVGAGNELIPVGDDLTYEVVNDKFINISNVQQMPFLEEGQYIDGTGGKGVTQNSYEMRPSVVRISAGRYLVAFQRLGNGNTTDTLGKTLWPLEVRAFSYSWLTAKYTQAGHKHGYVYAKDDLGIGFSDGYPEDNTRLLWYTNRQLYVWGITGNTSTTRPWGNAYLTRFGFLNLDGVCNLATVVGDICTRCDLDAATDFDVSDLEDTIVRGYVIGREMSGRAAAEPLQSIYFMVGAESDDKLKFRLRTGEPIASISEDLLGASSGDDQVIKITEMRGEEVTLPVSVAVKYLDPEQDYQQGAQLEKRNAVATDSSQNVSIDVPLVMTAQEAKDVAQKSLYQAWIGRTTVSASVAPELMLYDSTDVVTLNYESGAASLPVFITQNDFGADGLVMLEGVAADAVALVADSTPATPVFPVQGLSTPEDMTVYFLDGPLLRDDDDGPGFYQAARGETESWKGGTDYVSTNDTDFAPQQTFTVAAITGTTTTTLGAPASTWVTDNTNTVTVVLDGGSLSSVSTLDMLNGANRALIGDDERWELIGFTTATQTAANTYVLSGLLRGLQGTEWAAELHTSSDTFVFLQNDASIKSIVTGLGQVGALRYYRPVSFGQTVAGTSSVTFTQHAARIKPIAPCNVVGAWGGGTLAITFKARSRKSSALIDFADTYYDEPVVAFEVDVLDGNSPPAVLRTITSTASGGGSVVDPDTRTVTYTASDIASDFGSPVPTSVDVKIYAISSRIGRGYPASATL